MELFHGISDIQFNIRKSNLYINLFDSIFCKFLISVVFQNLQEVNRFSFVNMRLECQQTAIMIDLFLYHVVEDVKEKLLSGKTNVMSQSLSFKFYNTCYVRSYNIFRSIS